MTTLSESGVLMSTGPAVTRQPQFEAARSRTPEENMAVFAGSAQALARLLRKSWWQTSPPFRSDTLGIQDQINRASARYDRRAQ